VEGIRTALEREFARETAENADLGPRYLAAASALGSAAVHPGLLVGLAPRAPEAGAAPGHRWPIPFLLVTLLLLGCGWASWRSGGFDPRRLFLPRTILGYSVHAYDRHVRFRAIPGAGGVLPDGLVIDTTGDEGRHGCTTVRLPLGLIESEPGPLRGRGPGGPPGMEGRGPRRPGRRTPRPQDQLFGTDRDRRGRPTASPHLLQPEHPPSGSAIQ
jgi:hypothetical protein